LGAGSGGGFSEKSFLFKEKTVGVFIGVVVLLVCIGFVVLMMVSEWSEPSGSTPLAENPAAAPVQDRVKGKARKPAAKKKAPAKAKKSKKK
jgi:hypothetical protein